MLLTSALQADRPQITACPDCCLFVCVCVFVVRGAKCRVGRGRRGSLPLGSVQLLPPLGEGFFQPLSISVCQVIQVAVYPLHTCCTFSMLSKNSGSSYGSSESQLTDVFFHPSPLSFFIYHPSRCFGSFSPILPTLFLSCPQLYGEYREQLGNFARREAARLLTERQWRRQAGDAAAAGRKGHGRRHHHHHQHHHHPMTLESHHSHVSSTKSSRPYSKCQGDR